jgi:hypothetical protein
VSLNFLRNQTQRIYISQIQGKETWSLWALGSPDIEAATEALAERTPEDAVLIQEEMNFKELGRKPLLELELLLALLWLFFIVR